MENCFKTSISFLCSFLITFACQQKDVFDEEATDFPVIEILHNQQKEVEFMDLAKEVVQIPLEMTDSSLIVSVADVAISEKYVFVSDLNPENRLLKFDMEGNFIRRIGRSGEGPNEYGVICSIFFDENLSQLLVLDCFNRRIIVYSEEGDFLYAIRNREKMFFNLFRNGTATYLMEASFVEADDKGYASRHSLFLMDEDNHLIDSIQQTIRFKKGFQLVYRHPNFIFEQDTTTFFFIPTLLPEMVLRDTLYQLTANHQLKPYAKFRFLGKIDSQSEWVSFAIRDIQVTPSFYLVTYYYEKEDYIFVHDRMSGEGYTARGGFDYKDHPENYIARSKPNGQSYIVTNGESDEQNPTIHWIKWK